MAHLLPTDDITEHDTSILVTDMEGKRMGSVPGEAMEGADPGRSEDHV